jgi:DnaK suppressor protein
MLDMMQEAHLKRRLLDRRELLRGEIREALLTSGEERHRELAGAVHDSGDDSVADLLIDVNLKGMERDARELASIGVALDKMAQKEYGVCVDCGNDIGYARLEAQPIAARCIDCERRLEQRHAHGQGPTL